MEESEQLIKELAEALKGMLQVYGVRETSRNFDGCYVSSVEVEVCNQARSAIAKSFGRNRE